MLKDGGCNMDGSTNLCMNCMSDMTGKNACPRCGWSPDRPQMKHALPPGTVLQKRYVVGCAKKSNGEGITYIGFDTVLHIPVELHELFPQTICERAQDGGDVRVIGGSEVNFSECLAAFLNYARSVAHLRGLSSIVQIYDIFEENHTAYTVSEWNDSITLRYFIGRSGGSIGWNSARQLFMPVLSALSTMHESGVGHLGISPDTLFIMKDGKMRLGGFCIGAVRQMDTDLAPDMVPGCAAIEQYVMDYTPNEATDVYGFASSLFFALTGTLPPDALKRRTDARLLIPTNILRSLPPHVVTALANALQVSPDKRTPTFERLRSDLAALPAVTAAIEESRRFEKVRAQTPEPKRKKKEVPGFVWVLVSCLVMLVILTSVGVYWISRTGGQDLTADGTVASEAPSSAAESAEASLFLSKTDQIPVPNLVGQNFDKLTASASSQDEEDQDYQILCASRQFSDTVAEGFIISQQPVFGGTMTRGTAVVVVVSEGAAVRTLPPIAGLSISDASTAVTSAGFVPTQMEEYSDTVPSQQVIGYQDVKEGSQMAYGSKVVILVSKGPDPNKAASSDSSETSPGSSGT